MQSNDKGTKRTKTLLTEWTWLGIQVERGVKRSYWLGLILYVISLNFVLIFSSLSKFPSFYFTIFFLLLSFICSSISYFSPFNIAQKNALQHSHAAVHICIYCDIHAFISINVMTWKIISPPKNTKKCWTLSLLAWLWKF